MPEPEPEPEPVDEVAEKMFDTRLYGYINSYWEQSTFVKIPIGYARDDMGGGSAVEQRAPNEFDVLNFNVMVQGTVGNRFRYFFNLASPGAGSVIDDEPVALRNAWLEANLLGERLAIRGGKLYRRFGLYNEILDAVPTFIGIEAPEMFDKDHLMITRTTNLMLHGSYVMGENRVEYAAMTGNDERITYDDGDTTVPIGLDVNFTYKQMLKIGASYYDTIGKAVPGKGVGDGSPKGGVVNWMAHDKYRVLDAYIELRRGALIAQLEYCIAMHDAKRDAEAILPLGDPDSGLSPKQYARFFDTASAPFGNTPPTSADVIEDVEYNVQTAYLRLGYELMTGKLTPYLQVDYYKNPEIVGIKDLGGDNEAGWDDDGQFIKTTVGFVYRPIFPVALKMDFSTHTERFDGESYTYPELRISAAYFWELQP